MVKRGTISLVAAVLVVVAALTGCSSESSDSADAPDRNAAVLLPTQVCVINNSSTRTEAAITMADSGAETKVLWENYGDKLCGLGASSTQIIDVTGTFLTTNPNRTWNFGSGNRVIRLPGINVGYTQDGQYHSCIGQEMKVNESASFDDGFVTVTAQRLPDTDAKQFEIVISDSTNPSTTGVAKTCRTLS
jgi:hypothetical protein